MTNDLGKIGVKSMIKKPSRATARVKRHYRIRNKISGTAAQPRLAVFRSNQHIYAQVIDDTAKTTLVAASTMESDIASKLEKHQTLKLLRLLAKLLQKNLSIKVLQKLFSTEAVMYTTVKLKH